MLTRIAILVALAGLVGGGYLLMRLWQARRIATLSDSPSILPDDVAALVPHNTAAVLAFSTPSCAECRTRQAPALQRLSTTLGARVAVVSLSALDHPELVAQFGILTVPATVVLDASRQVRHINLGYASTQQLAEQITQPIA